MDVEQLEMEIRRIIMAVYDIYFVLEGNINTTYSSIDRLNMVFV